MPVLGLVLQLEDQRAATRARVGRALSVAADLELGEPAEHRWPAVLEANSERDAELRIEAFRDLPGVAGVDVVYADFEDLIERSAAPRAREEV